MPTLQFREKDNYLYIHVDTENQVHLMVPMSAGMAIATDNTCKSFEALNQFFGHSSPAPSALQIVQQYKQDLQQDIAMLNQTMQASASSVLAGIRQKKQARLDTLRQYEQLLQNPGIVLNKLFLQNHYPAAIKDMLARETNLFPIALSPEQADTCTKLDPHIFAVTRPSHCGDASTSGLGYVLRQVLATTTYSNVSSAGGHAVNFEEVVQISTEQRFNQLNVNIDNMEQFLQCIGDTIRQQGGIDVDVKQTLLNFHATQIIEGQEHLTEPEKLRALFQLMAFFDNAEESDIKGLIETVIEWVKDRQPNHSLTQGESIFKLYFPEAQATPEQKEKLSITIQFFLALINAHCYSENLFDQAHQKLNMAAVIEGVGSSTTDDQWYISFREGGYDIQSKAVYNAGGWGGLIYRWDNQQFTAVKKQQRNGEILYISQAIPDDFRPKQDQLRAKIDANQSNFTEGNWLPMNLLSTPLLNDFQQTVQQAIQNGEPVENTLYAFINRHYNAFFLKRAINSEEMRMLAARFQALFPVINNMPHFDEFLLLLDKPVGVGYSHMNNICVTMAEYLRNTSHYGQYFDSASSCSSESKSTLPTHITCSKRAVFLSHKNPVETLFIDVTQAASNALLGSEEDQNILIHPALEQAIYQKALIRMQQLDRVAGSQTGFAHLGGGERLSKALSIIGINLDQSAIRSDPTGYYVTIPATSCTVLRQVEAEYRRRIHVTPAMASSLYQAASAIPGYDLDSYNNNEDINAPRSKIRRALSLLGVHYSRIAYEGHNGYLINAYSFDPNVSYEQDIEKIRHIHIQHMPRVLLSENEFNRMAQVMKINDLRGLIQKLGFYSPHIVYDNHTQKHVICLEQEQIAAFDAMKADLLANRDNDYYVGGFIRRVPESLPIKFTKLNTNALSPADGDWKKLVLSQGNGLVTWYVCQRQDECSADVIDIQSEQAYHKCGVVYRLWEDGRCRTSFKRGVGQYHVPTAEDGVTLSDVEVFFQHTLPSMIQYMQGEGVSSALGINADATRQRRLPGNMHRRGVSHDGQVQSGSFANRVTAGLQPSSGAVAIPQGVSLQQLPARILSRDDIVGHLTSPPPALISQPNLLLSLQTGQTVRYTEAWFAAQNAQENPNEETPIQCEQRVMRRVWDQQQEIDRRPPLTKIADLVAVCEYEKNQSSQAGVPQYSFITGADASVLPGLAYFENAVFVGAAQGNGLEAIDSHHIPWVKDYYNDHTQGPALQATTPDAAISRLLFRKQGDMVNVWLKQYDPNQQLFHYKNGYLTPKLGADNLRQALALMRDHGSDLLANLQRVYVRGHCRLADADMQGHWYAQDELRTMTHMTCFAINIGQMSDTAWSWSDQQALQDDQTQKDLLSGICCELLKHQYKAVAAAAVLQARASGCRVPLVLTPLGGGAFRNPLHRIAEAMSVVQPIVADENVDVILSIYNSDDLQSFQAVAGFANAPTNTMQDFERLSPANPAPVLNVSEDVSSGSDAVEVAEEEVAEEVAEATQTDLCKAVLAVCDRYDRERKGSFFCPPRSERLDSNGNFGQISRLRNVCNEQNVTDEQIKTVVQAIIDEIGKEKGNFFKSHLKRWLDDINTKDAGNFTLTA
jgi:hypothetical protein